MIKITMLGTGNGGTIDLYNTCFTIQNKEGIFLIDTGGSIEIIKRLKQANIKLDEIKHIFISHSHTDHILGLIWIFKKMGRMAMNREIKPKINIYCNEIVYEAIKGVSNYILSPVLMESIYNITNFVILNDCNKYMINGVEYEFFDILAKGTKQFGFECMLEDNRFIFLGDETLNPKLNERIMGADYVTHEAFCLDREENIFHAYEKNHSTALSAAKTMNELDVKNLILYHTEESHGSDRKRLYLEEAQSVFEGNVIVPDDLEEIQLVKTSKNMDLVNIIYRYVNRFINSTELIKLLMDIDKSKLSENETKKIEELLEEVKKVIETVPIEIDQVEIKRMTSLNNILEALEKIKTNEKNSKETKNFAKKRYDSLVKEKAEIRDSGPRYEKLYELLTNNSVYVNYCRKMSDLELLEFITQYISAPVTPNIDQETFNNLVSVGIEKDKREALWRLAFNYKGKKKDFTRIENYFVDKRDDYYLTELISAVQEDLNMNELIEKVINTKDTNFIIGCGSRAKNIGIFTDEEIENLKERIKGNK